MFEIESEGSAEVERVVGQHKSGKTPRSERKSLKSHKTTKEKDLEKLGGIRRSLDAGGLVKGAGFGTSAGEGNEENLTELKKALTSGISH